MTYVYQPTTLLQITTSRLMPPLAASGWHPSITSWYRAGGTAHSTGHAVDVAVDHRGHFASPVAAASSPQLLREDLHDALSPLLARVLALLHNDGYRSLMLLVEHDHLHLESMKRDDPLLGRNALGILRDGRDSASPSSQHTTRRPNQVPLSLEQQIVIHWYT